jgi:hypothetical protein
MRDGGLIRLGTRKRDLWRDVVSSIGAIIASLLMTCPAVAQVPNTPASPTPTVTTRPLYFEVMIVVVMIGVSLYVVCRSSRRN